MSETSKEKEKVMNSRCFERYLDNIIIEHSLSPSISFYPKYSKYNMYPESSITIQKDNNKPLKQEVFSKNVNVESELRNQFFASSKNDTFQYVPDSNSSLFNPPLTQSFDNFFFLPKEENIEEINKYNDDFIFNNFTQQKLKLD